LARGAAAISVAEVVAAIDGDIGLTQCSVHAEDCDRTTYCPTRPHWAAINRAVGAALEAISLDDMISPFTFAAPGLGAGAAAPKAHIVAEPAR
jgi:DNA-binding IscR family transcriptional regulator